MTYNVTEKRQLKQKFGLALVGNDEDEDSTGNDGWRATAGSAELAINLDARWLNFAAGGQSRQLASAYFIIGHPARSRLMRERNPARQQAGGSRSADFRLLLDNPNSLVRIMQSQRPPTGNCLDVATGGIGSPA